MFAPRVAKSQTKAAASPTNKLSPQRPALAARRFGDDAVDRAHVLQRSIGNRATLRLLAPRATSLAGNEPHDRNEQEVGPTSLTARGATPGVSWDFSKIPRYPPERGCRSQASSLPGIIQPKLVVGAIDDPLEREADRVADQVMRTSNP